MDLQHSNCTVMFLSLSYALAALYISGNDTLLGVSCSFSRKIISRFLRISYLMSCAFLSGQNCSTHQAHIYCILHFRVHFYLHSGQGTAQDFSYLPNWNARRVSVRTIVHHNGIPLQQQANAPLGFPDSQLFKWIWILILKIFIDISYWTVNTVILCSTSQYGCRNLKQYLNVKFFCVGWH